MKILLLFLTMGMMTTVEACDQSDQKAEGQPSSENLSEITVQDEPLDTATFAGGCFWCVEAAFEQIIGVREVVSGYSGGDTENPGYEAVSMGRTDHAESVQIYYAPDEISYRQLLEIFFVAHDPTQLNRQGPDVGKQYRSAIFYHNARQQRLAEEVMTELEEAGKFPKPIVTELKPLTIFWKAEEYHQDYARRNPDNRYVQSVSVPKVKKVQKKFPDLLKQ